MPALALTKITQKKSSPFDRTNGSAGIDFAIAPKSPV